MRKLVFTLCVFSLAFTARSQNDTGYVDIGVNIIRLANLGLGDSNLDYDVWNPYLLNIDGHYKRIGVRVGLGMRSQQDNELPTDANGMSTFERDTSRMDLRIGLNWDIHVHPKWTCKVGVDYFKASELHRKSSAFTDEFDQKVETEQEVEMNETGFAPFVYIQYHITPRISLGTELLWRFSSYTLSDTDNSNLNDAIIEHKYEGTKRGIMAPTALFLNVRF